MSNRLDKAKIETKCNELSHCDFSTKIKGFWLLLDLFQPVEEANMYWVDKKTDEKLTDS